MKYKITLICIFLWSSFYFSQTLKTPTLSPFSQITQEIGLTEVALEYSRPSAKGRTVFGELVPYDKIWRTGANASTKITLLESAYIDGKSIQSGTYALYTIPGEEVWTIIIHSNTKLRSLAGDAYNPAEDVFRLDIKPQSTDNYIETFTIQFTDLQSNSLNLQLVWENTLVSIPIEFEVDQQIEQQMTEFMNNPDSIPHRTYFEAAQYWLNNNKDLGDALTFINVALDKSPENFRYGLLKAKIQDKNGDFKAALVTINDAHNWATTAKKNNYIEQTELFKQTLIVK